MAKVTRKELLKQDDAFLAAASQSAQWVGSHRAPVILAVVGAVAVVLAAWGVIELRSYRTQRGATALEAALTILNAEVVGEEKAAPSATPPTFASEQVKWRAAEERFSQIARDEGLHGAGVLAAFYSGDLRQKLGDNGPAEAQLTALFEALQPSDSLFFLAVERVAYLQEGRGELKQAALTWQRLVDGTDAFYADTASFELARLYIKQGEAEQARRLLESFEAKFASSPLREKAADALAQLGPAL
ncbi:MAG: hypothetical protein AAB426_02270 [Myxococcota bacterium]